MAFLGAMGYMIGYGFVNGNPYMLVAPLDSNNQFCGYSPGLEGYDYLYLYNIIDAADNPS